MPNMKDKKLKRRARKLRVKIEDRLAELSVLLVRRGLQKEATRMLCLSYKLSELLCRDVELSFHLSAPSKTTGRAEEISQSSPLTFPRTALGWSDPNWRNSC